MVAEAKAKVDAARGQGQAGAAPSRRLPAEDAKPLEDRYLDDGTVTVEDRKKFSLRCGRHRHRRCPRSAASSPASG